MAYKRLFMNDMFNSCICEIICAGGTRMLPQLICPTSKPAVKATEAASAMALRTKLGLTTFSSSALEVWLNKILSARSSGTSTFMACLIFASRSKTSSTNLLLASLAANACRISSSFCFDPTKYDDEILNHPFLSSLSILRIQHLFKLISSSEKSSHYCVLI